MPRVVRVAYDTTPLLGPRTGVGTFTHRVLEELARRDDLQVVAYATTWRGRHELADLLPPGVGLARGPMAARPLRTAWKRLDRPPITWWTGPVDVVHGTNFVVPPAPGAAELVTVHDLTSLRFPAMCTPDVLETPALIGRAIARGAHVHVVSRYVGHEVQERFDLPADRVHVVHNGVDLVAGGDPEAGRQAAGGHRYVLALSTIEPRKDHPTLVAAFDQLAQDHPDLRLVVAGPDGWGVEAYHRAVEAAHHRDRIVRLGWVDAATRADLLAGASVFAYPSRYEGFGLPPLEAMSAGAPVVATATGPLPEVLGAAALLVPPADPAALAAALARALEPDEAARLRAAGQQQVARYSWRACADELARCYRALAPPLAPPAHRAA